MENTFDSALFDEFYGVQPQAVIWKRPIWNVDHTQICDFEYTYCNPEGLLFMNLKPEQLKGLRISNTASLTDDLRQKVLQELIDIYNTGKSASYDIYNAAVNKYARVIRVKFRDGVLSIIQDRTEEQQTIKQLDEQKTLLDNILKNSSSGISVSVVERDETDKIIDALTILANDAAIKYIGLPKEIYLTKKATEIEPGIFETPYYRACVHTLETGEPFVMQYQMESNGKWLELSVSRLDRNHLIHVFTDVTPIREAHLELEKTVEELRKSNENLAEFAYAASHDLQEPLRKIITFSEKLRDTLGVHASKEQEDTIQRMISSTGRMKQLIEDLLSYSKIGSEHGPAESVDLDKIVDDVLQDMENILIATGGVITKDDLPEIKGHTRQIRQLFHNLISNALKYRKPNVAPEINISCTLAEDPVIRGAVQKATFYKIDIKDNGIGFDQQYAEKIFQVFQRLHGKAEYEGTGVGLAIVKKVATNHNGFITVSSIRGEGSCFSVFLPKT